MNGNAVQIFTRRTESFAESGVVRAPVSAVSVLVPSIPRQAKIVIVAGRAQGIIRRVR